MLITFDSNVWQQVVSPEKSPEDPQLNLYNKIHSLIRSGSLKGRLSETIFTYEAIKRKDRPYFLSQVKLGLELLSEIEDEETITFSFLIFSDPSAHIRNNEYLRLYLEDARNLGFEIMECPRIGKIINTDVPPDLYAQLNLTVDEVFSSIVNDLEARGLGSSWARAIGEKYKEENQTWLNGLGNAPESERSRIIKAVAEWADGDSVAAHIAFGNNLFCTLDQGKGAGSASILSPKNKLWLQSKYQVKFVTPQELCKLMS
ncbi:hypothetical protein H6F46_00090 [Limnothrix sp. FACHB-1083]|uniref:hypothetical protein n=1 Tax=unclassified Limnothrix TaxID=2632864 RepID=UPI0016803877|nr:MULTISPECIES: hypothetical protein [unclassified Limnothrix]MBD2159084.1 hypothetical protein [Limnothrix sp. FACHB-1083]MBD2191789.1 hypothetical protein [Limnothrix sp. FACHB-1088]